MLWKVIRAEPTPARCRARGVVGQGYFALKALIERVCESRQFSEVRNKVAYLYALTPQGVAEKASLAAAFLGKKLYEYEVLKVEIDTLRTEI